MRATWRLLLPVLLIACADPAPDGGAADEPNATFAPELEVNLDSMTRSPSGLYTQDLKEGAGPAAEAGQMIAAHYTGWLPDGTEFDSSRPRGVPLEIVLGQGMVIRGWDEGLQGMKVGGVRRLVIPPELAYGDQGAGGVIPPGATLVFEVELMEIKP